MDVDHDAFAVWFAANRRPDLGGRTYEHAMFVRWASEQLAQVTRERDGLLDVLATATREATDLRAQLSGVVS